VNDYFVYLPENTGTIWGCTATSAGYTRVSPHSLYPPKRHPLDHHFSWSQGRILQAYQVILISEGTGVFEDARGSHPVQAETVLILLPGVWHRYTPTPETGWVEHWMEFRGPVFDEALKQGILSAENPTLSVKGGLDVFTCFDRCHAIVQRGALAGQEMLSTLGLHLLSVLARIQRGGAGHASATDAAVDRAQALIALRCQEPLHLSRLAREIGVSYSRLRQSFKQRLGVSPKQYHLQVRLTKARDLLANTTKSIKEIADILGFESAFHLSKQFKSRMGESPVIWRKHRTPPPG
jgi:AraC-like DNA-binding protein